jgi:hypothetical protein
MEDRRRSDSPTLASRLFRSPTVDGTTAVLPLQLNANDEKAGRRPAELLALLGFDQVNERDRREIQPSVATTPISAPDSAHTSYDAKPSTVPPPPPPRRRSAPPTSPEHRTDPNDGFYYPKSAFVDFYGGISEWEAAHVQPAEEVEEFRIDTSDGCAYARKDWTTLYGGTVEWDAAQAPSKGTRRASRMEVELKTHSEPTILSPLLDQIDEGNGPESERPPTPTTLPDAKEEENQTDLNDGFNYPKSDFVTFCGGSCEWESTRVPPAEEVEEFRIDPSDGCAYARKGWIALYGGTVEWDAAQVPAMSTRRSSRMEAQVKANLEPTLLPVLFGPESERPTPTAFPDSTSSTEEEHRIDQSDGSYYPKETFIAFYGGDSEWEAAHVKPAEKVGEFRIDPSDGCAYAKEDWIALYGGTVEWDGAQTPSEGTRRSSRIEAQLDSHSVLCVSSILAKEYALTPISETAGVERPEGNECRIDLSDGFAYSKLDFLSRYGREGEWNSSLPPPRVSKTEKELSLLNELRDILPKRRSSIDTSNYENVLARTKAQYDSGAPRRTSDLEQLILNISGVTLRDHRLPHPVQRLEKEPLSPESVPSPVDKEQITYDYDYRLDPCDGYAYSREDFVQRYGGTNEWDSACSAFGGVGDWEEVGPVSKVCVPNISSDETSLKITNSATKIQRAFRAWSAMQWQHFEIGQLQATKIQASFRARTARRQWLSYRNALRVFAMRFRRKMHRMEASRPLEEQKLTFKMKSVRGHFVMRALTGGTATITNLRLSWEDSLEQKANVANLGREIRQVETNPNRLSEITEVALTQSSNGGRLVVTSSESRIWEIALEDKVSCSMLKLGLQNWAEGPLIRTRLLGRGN